MADARARMKTIEHSLREHFESQIQRVAVPEPGRALRAAPDRRRIPSVALAGLFHAAMVVLIAGSLVLYLELLPRSTPLRRAIASTTLERRNSQ